MWPQLKRLEQPCVETKAHHKLLAVLAAAHVRVQKELCTQLVPAPCLNGKLSAGLAMQDNDEKG